MFDVRSPGRLSLGLFLIFVTVASTSAFADWLWPRAAMYIGIAISTCIIVFILHRWRAYPPRYDYELRELRALLNLSSLTGDFFLPYGKWAMEPQALVDIVDHIQVANCQTIVECGSGVTTMVIAGLLRRRARGHLYSIEHDARWYELMSELISTRKLDQYVTVIYAPLERCQIAAASSNWYATTCINEGIKGVNRIDLLIIDGPITVDQLSRAPALPFFWSRLDTRSLIILDDANRPEERSILSRWQGEFGVSYELRGSTRRGQAYIQSRHIIGS